jgi:D-alanine-D-alanine ligase
MRKLNLAFIYNVRHQYPDPNDPRSQLETDFDDQKTIDTMVTHLKKQYNVLPIEANQEAYLTLYDNRNKIDIVYNYSEGIFGLDRYAQIPAMLEMLQIPYTGSSPLTQALLLNKSRMKEVLSFNKIPTLPFQLFETGQEKISEKISFPAIVKPVSQGSSAGITNKSVVNDKKNLRRQVISIIKGFSQPALVEPFIEGREFSIGLLGNPPQVLPIIEPDHSLLPKNYLPFDSLEVKWYFEEENNVDYLRCPAKIEPGLRKKVTKICLETFAVLKIRDYCRIDIKCDLKGNPYVLDVNSPAGMIPPEISTTSYFPLACRAAGLDYGETLKTIINMAIKRSRAFRP